MIEANWLRDALQKASNGGDVVIGILTGDLFAIVDGKIMHLEMAMDRAENLTRYCQRDPAWKDFEYVPGYMLGRWGCLICVYAMLASLAGYSDDPPTFAAKVRDAGGFAGGRLARPEVIPQVYPLMAWEGRENWTGSTPADLSVLRAEIEAHGPTAVQVDFKPGTTTIDEHYVVALGFEGADLRIVDPWDGAETLLLQRYAQDNWSLERAVRGVRRLHVA